MCSESTVLAQKSGAATVVSTVFFCHLNQNEATGWAF